MGVAKDRRMLASGQITRVEFDRRAAQRAASRRVNAPQITKTARRRGGAARTTTAVRELIRAEADLARISNQTRNMARAAGSGKGVWTPSMPSQQELAERALSYERPIGRVNMDMAWRYILTCLDPRQHMSRYPDSEARATSLFRSIVTYDIPINDQTDDKFSMCLQPIIGDISALNTFQSAIVDPTKAKWDGTDDWSDPSLYQAYLNGSDPRVDVNSNYLTSPPVGYFGQNTNSISTAPPNPVFFAPKTDAVADVVPSPANTGVTVTGITGDYDTIVLSEGVFYVVIQIQYVTGVDVTGVVPEVLASSSATFINNGWATGSALTGGTVTCSIRGFVNSTGSKNKLVLGLKYATGSYDATSSFGCWINVVPTVSALLPFPSSSGLIEEVRPVGMSALVTYMGPSLVDGGQITIAYTPDDYATSNYFGQTSQRTGQAQYYSNLARVPGSYNGPLKDGAYAWWSPYDSTAARFLPVKESNERNWPSLVCSGVFSPGSPGNSSSGYIRLLATFVFEYVSTSTAVEAEKMCGDQVTLDFCNKYLSDRSHTMPNKSHRGFIGNAVREATRFVGNNKSWLIPLASAALL